MELRLTLIILFLLILYTISAIWYAWKNDFADEINSILLPVLGTALLSIFISVKFILIDAPDNPPSVKGTLIILHNQRTNQFIGLALDESKMGTKYINRNGLKNINQVIWRNEFQKLKIPEHINLNDSHAQRSSLLMDCLVYNIFLWFAEINKVQGSWLNIEYMHKFPPGYSFSEDARPQITKKMIDVLSVDARSFPNNILFSLSPIEINMPSGARVKSIEINNSYMRELKISSRHSDIKIILQMMTGGSWNVNSAQLSSNIKEYLIKYGDEFVSYIFSYEINQNLNKLNRYSKEGKLHPIWFKTFSEKFEKAFSWESFEKVYK